MNLLILTAIIAAVASSPLTQDKSWPWQVSREYVYDVETYTWTKFDNNYSVGNVFKAQFIIRVLAPGQLIAKLSKPFYAKIQEEKATYHALPSNLKFQPMQITKEYLEIFVEGGRIKSLNVPDTYSIAHENLVKGLLSALQADISTFGHVDNFPNSFDKETFQGLFKKVETDVTGECETLYTIAPLSAEWRREIPKFSSVEDPVEIIKGKHYDSCKNRFTLYSGIPEGAIWNGIAYKNEEKQFIKHIFESRLVAGKQGTIYKSEVLSTVFVSPLLYGKQKAEVFSYVKIFLSSVQEDQGANWAKPEMSRRIDSLLFSISDFMFAPKSDSQTITNVLRLLADMATSLQTPNELPKTDFLSKFNVLLRLIMSLSSEQLALTTSNIENYGFTKMQSCMLLIYRDAVAQAGTVAAFREIKSWILTKKIQGEEAAELITSIGVTMFQPSTDFQAEFFDFVLSPEVAEQQYLNSSALLAATKMFRTDKKISYVNRHVIPKISEMLKKAVENGDSNKAQVYVRALGNLAHEAVLMAFAPYLEGHIAVTKYLRIQMVASLKSLANLKNESVRAVLFSILRNTAEPYEVRVLAALNIFMAFPTPEMMYVMARMTNDDPSTQVRAVLANGINLAAELKDPRFTELAKTARSVKTFVTKEKFGYRLSTDSLFDEYTSDDDIAFFGELSSVGSEDAFLPIYQRLALRSRGTGLDEENQVTLSISNVQQLLEYIAQMIYEPNKSKVKTKMSAKELIESLKIKRDPREPLQGALFFEILNQQKLITFNEADLKAFIASTIQNMEQLITGVNVQHTKLLSHHKHTYVLFPLAAGVPFFFEYSEPLLYSLKGSVQIAQNKTSKHFDGSLHTNLDITFARNLDGAAGYLDTLDNAYVRVGVINKIQFNFPTNLNIGVQSKQIKMNFELPKEDTNLIHMSVWPYTSRQKIDNILTTSKHPLTKFIDHPAKVLSNDFSIGSLNLKGYSYSSDFEDVSDFYDTDVLTSIGNLIYLKDIALTQFDLRYIVTESNTQDITLSLFYDTLYNQVQSEETGPVSVMKDDFTESDRRREIVKRAASGIKYAEVHVFDFSAVLNGKEKVKYVFTTALADSSVDNKIQGAFFVNGSEQINSVFKMVKPKIVPLDFEEALKNKIKVTYEVDLKYGNSENVHVQGFGERSEEYTKMLASDPLAKQCLQETSNYNFYQINCYKMIIKAHAPDYFKMSMTYKDLSPEYLILIRNAYQMSKKMLSGKLLENAAETKANHDKVEIEVQSFYYDNYENYKLTSKFGVLQLNNVDGLGFNPYTMAVYEPIIDWDRVLNYYFGYDHLPYCAIDNSQIWTFSSRSYNYSLTSSWHVVMVDESNDFGKWTDLVILARRSNDKQDEVQISYKTEAGKYVELEINPSAVKVDTNTDKVTEGELTTYWNDVEEAPLLQYYTLDENVLVFNINNGALRVMYDKQRLVIFTANHRGTTRGLCGQSSTQTRDDFMTPYGLVDQPELYGASFSLNQANSDPRTVELKKEAKLKAYQPAIKYTNILRSDVEWSNINNKYSNHLDISSHHDKIYNQTFSNK